MTRHFFSKTSFCYRVAIKGEVETEDITSDREGVDDDQLMADGNLRCMLKEHWVLARVAIAAGLAPYPRRDFFVVKYSKRSHEEWCTGRKKLCPGRVLDGDIVGLVAGHRFLTGR